MAGGHSLNIKQGPGPRNRRHPSRIRPGQRFFPLTGTHRQRLTVKELGGEWVRVEREDGSKGRVSLDKLLASHPAGDGVHYRFHGWRRLPRGYRTDFVVSCIAEEEEARCSIVLPEWDPETVVELPLAALPPALRSSGATGSCRADLTAASHAGLALHGFSGERAKGLSRAVGETYPEFVVGGQEYRRRTDGKRFRLLEVQPGSPTVSAWSRRRVVRLEVIRLLARGPDGDGLHYVFIGGGLTAARRRRAAKRNND